MDDTSNLSEVVADRKLSKQLSLTLSPEARQTLEEISRRRGGVSYAEVVRRAIGTELYLIKEQQEGSRIFIEGPDKTIRQIVLR